MKNLDRSKKSAAKPPALPKKPRRLRRRRVAEPVIVQDEKHYLRREGSKGFTKKNSKSPISKSAGAPSSDHPTPGEALDLIRQSIERGIGKYRKNLCENLQSIVDNSIKIQKSMKVWNDFRSDHYWLGRKSRPKLGDRQDALRFALKRALPDDRKEQQNANFYLQAITKLTDEGVPIDQLASQLKSRGLRRLAEEIAKEKRLKAKGDDRAFGLNAKADVNTKRSKGSKTKRRDSTLERGDVVSTGTAIFKPGSRMESIKFDQPVWIRGIVRSIGPDLKVEFLGWKPDLASE